ncbi:MAG: AgmX/PglI C-terminal domain-containing protein [Kofleriaceae bacterium]
MRPVVVVATLTLVACGGSGGGGAASSEPVGHAAPPVEPTAASEPTAEAEPGADDAPTTDVIAELRVPGSSGGFALATGAQPGGSTGAAGSKQDIHAVIRAALPDIKACYTDALPTDPTLQGKVQASFQIEAGTGRVSSSTATGVSAEVSRCVADVIRGLTFPPSGDPNGTLVHYPFVFKQTS